MSKQVVKVTLELDPQTHKQLDRWAGQEARSKRKHAALLVTQQVREWCKGEKRQPATA